jgi:hypothetical protein
LIRSVPVRGMNRLGAEVTSGAIVSAVDADTGEPLPDFVSDNSGPLFVPATTTAAAGSSGPAVFTSPNAYASGTGLGPLNLPSIIPASLANLLPNANTMMLILVAIAAVWLVSENQK